MKSFATLFFVILIAIIGLSFLAWKYDFGQNDVVKPKPKVDNDDDRNAHNQSLDLEFGVLIQYKTYYTFNETKLLADTFLDANTVCELPINTPVKIVNFIGREEKIDGLYCYWYKVKYKNKTGYLVSNDIAFSRLKLPSSNGTDDYALINLDSYNSSVNVKVKHIRNATEANSFVFQSFANGDEGYFGYDVTCKLQSNKGLSGVKKVIDIDMSYGACGYYNGSHYLFWDGENIYDGIDDSGMGDADYISVSTNIIFPNESGKKDTIISHFASYEYEHNEQDSIIHVDSTKETKMYFWKEKEGLEEL